jgi:hypothetical protein
MNDYPASLTKRKFSFDEIEKCLEIFLAIIARSVRPTSLDWLGFRFVV